MYLTLKKSSSENILKHLIEIVPEILQNFLKAYSEPTVTSKIDSFAKIVNCFQPVTIFAKS